MDETTPTTDPSATPPVDNGMGSEPAVDPAAAPAMPPTEGGDAGAAPAAPAEGEEKPAEDVPAPM